MAMPRTTGVDPFTLAAAFAQQLQREAEQLNQEGRRLDAVPVEQAIKLRNMKEAAALELDSYGKRLALADPYEQAKESRANTEYDRRQRVSTDENIRQEGEREKRLIERYKTYPQLLQRGGRTSTGSTQDPNESAFNDEFDAKQFVKKNPDYEYLGIKPDKQGKASFVVRKKGAGSTPSTTAPVTTEPQPSGKGGKGAPASPPEGKGAFPENGERVPINPDRFDLNPGKPTSSLGGLPLLATIDDVPDRFRDLVQLASSNTGVDADLIAATMKQESGFKPAARSPVGAQGLMQIMPGTARELGVNPWNPQGAIEGGARYLAQGLEQYEGNVGLALARYNAGPKGVERYLKTGRIPRETRNYVKAITGYSIEDWVEGNVPLGEENEQVNASREDKDPLYWVA